MDKLTTEVIEKDKGCSVIDIKRLYLLENGKTTLDMEKELSMFLTKIIKHGITKE